jgi:hypothetical protein
VDARGKRGVRGDCGQGERAGRKREMREGRGTTSNVGRSNGDRNGKDKNSERGGTGW